MCTFLIGLCATFHQKQLQDSSAEGADAGADANDVTAASLDNMVSTLTDYPSSWMDGPAEYVTWPNPPLPFFLLFPFLSLSHFSHPPSPRCLPRHERMSFLLHCLLPRAALSLAEARHGTLPSEATVHHSKEAAHDVPQCLFLFPHVPAVEMPWRSAPFLPRVCSLSSNRLHMAYLSVYFSFRTCPPLTSPGEVRRSFLIALAPLFFAGSMTRSKATWSVGREQTRRARTSCPRGLAWPTHQTFLRYIYMYIYSDRLFRGEFCALD
jgi:hypothetical protein